MAVNESSPANSREAPESRKRIPMGQARQKLSVDGIPGFHLHWMRGTQERLNAALQGGYEFVHQDEISGLINFQLGGDAATDGNTDMGTRVSHISGETLDSQGQPERLYLMKIREEWFQEDQQLQEGRNQDLMAALRAGTIGAEKDSTGKDTASRYAKVGDNMFTPRRISRS